MKHKRAKVRQFQIKSGTMVTLHYMVLLTNNKRKHVFSCFTDTVIFFPNNIISNFTLILPLQIIISAIAAAHYS